MVAGLRPLSASLHACLSPHLQSSKGQSCPQSAWPMLPTTLPHLPWSSIGSSRYPVFSIKKRKQDAPLQDSDGILGSLERCVHVLYLLFVPVLFHAASNCTTIFRSWANVYDLLLLFFVPFLFQFYAFTHGSLWWTTRDTRTMDQIMMTNFLVVLVIAMLCLEV